MTRDPNLSIVVSDHLDDDKLEREANERERQYNCGRNQFITRMVTEYKASLVKYVERARNYIDEYADDNPNSGGATYWRAELSEAMRQLELSDSELLPFIAPSPPHRIA